MNFTAQSVWEMTKLYIRDPGEAARRVLLADLPLNVSVLMMVLAGVVSGALSAIIVAVVGPQEMVLELADGSQMAVAQASPIMTGVLSALMGLVFAYLLFWVGQKAGGTGTLPQVMSVVATLQIALTVLTAAAVLLDFLVPLVSFVLSLLVIYVSIRGIGHAVKEGHRFETMVKAIWVIIGAIAMLFVVLIFVAALIGPSLMGVPQ